MLGKVHQFLTFTTPPNLQAAVAYGLGKEDAFFHDLRRDLQRSRDRLSAGLTSIGFPVIPAQGTYFLNVDIKPLGLNEMDEAFCKAERVTLVGSTTPIEIMSPNSSDSAL